MGAAKTRVKVTANALPARVQPFQRIRQRPARPPRLHIDRGHRAMQELCWSTPQASSTAGRVFLSPGRCAFGALIRPRGTDPPWHAIAGLPGTLARASSQCHETVRALYDRFTLGRSCGVRFSVFWAMTLPSESERVQNTSSSSPTSASISRGTARSTMRTSDGGVVSARTRSCLCRSAAVWRPHRMAMSNSCNRSGNCCNVIA